MGKSRSGGVRKPFDWMVPRILAEGEDILGCLIPFFEGLYKANKDACFLVPCLHLQRCGRRGVMSNQATWKLGSPMTYGKFLELARGIIDTSAVGQADAAAMTFNTFRRFMPTAVEALQFSETAMQSLSNSEQLGLDLPRQCGCGLAIPWVRF